MNSSFARFEASNVVVWAKERLAWIVQQREKAWTILMIERNAVRRRRRILRYFGLFRDLKREDLPGLFPYGINSPAQLHWDTEHRCQRLLRLAAGAVTQDGKVYLTADDWKALRG